MEGEGISARATMNVKCGEGEVLGDECEAATVRDLAAFTWSLVSSLQCTQSLQHTTALYHSPEGNRSGRPLL